VLDFEKDEFDACMKQAEFSFKSFDTRRQFEWKLTLGVWGFICLATKFVGDTLEKSRCQGECSKPLEIALISTPILICLVHSMWLRGIQEANQRDREKRLQYQHAAHMILYGKRPSYANIKYDEYKPSSEWRWREVLKRLFLEWSFLKEWSSLFQFSVTAMLAIGCSLLLWARFKP
jgi:hypothetical protein